MPLSKNTLYPVKFTANKGGFMHLLSNGKENRARLTNRENEILRLVAEGLTAQEVSKKIFISQGTVETHKRNIIQKLNARNAVDAVTKAFRSGLIT